MAMEKTVLKAAGLTCEHCEERVKNALLSTNGVFAVAVSLEKAAIEIQFDGSQATVEQLASTVEEQGYHIVGKSNSAV
jgi:copper chaperone